MRRFLAWFRKEARERRALLLGLGAAIPALTAACFLVFSERLGIAARGSRGVRIDPEAATFSRMFFVGAVTLVIFTLASDLFSADRRTGALAAVRRIPHGLGMTFLAKFSVLALVLAGAVAWQWLSLGVAWAATGLPDSFARTARAVLPEEGHPAAWEVLLPVAFAVWVALASCWIPTSAAAVGGAGLLWVALIVPGWFVVRRDLLVAHGLLPVVPTVIVVLAAVGIVAAVVSVLRGCRFERGPWSAAWRGLVTVGVLATASLAYAAEWVSELVEFVPGEGDVAIDQAILGEDERWLFVQAHSGPSVHDESRRGPETAKAVFAFDLKTGESRRLGRFGSWLTRVSGAPFERMNPHRPLAPVPYLVCRRAEVDDKATDAWIDGRTAEVLKVLPAAFTPREALPWIRAGLRAETPLRDPDGGKVWIRPCGDADRGVVERDGALAADAPPRANLIDRTVRWIPEGWVRLPRSGDRPVRWIVHDANTGLDASVRDVNLDGASFLSPRRWLRRDVFRGRVVPEGPWLVGDVATGEERAALNPPAVVGGDVGVADHVLAWREGAGCVLWNPVTGEDVALEHHGPPLGRPDALGSSGSRGDRGWHLVRVTRAHADSLAVLYPAERTLLHVKSGVRDGRFLPVALTDDGDLIAVEDRRKVVRLRPNGLREVLVPRGER